MWVLFLLCDFSHIKQAPQTGDIPSAVLQSGLTVSDQFFD